MLPEVAQKKSIFRDDELQSFDCKYDCINIGIQNQQFDVSYKHIFYVIANQKMTFMVTSECKKIFKKMLRLIQS